SRRRRAIWIVVSLLVVVIVACALWRYRFWFMNPNVTSSVSDGDNIAYLSSRTPMPEGIKGVEVAEDSILGVAFTSYPLQGLRGSIERELPDTADRSVVLMMRSADYYPDGKVIGTMVIDGTPIPAKERRTRPGYVALSKDGKTAIGISLTDRVSDRAADSVGSFFRQFAILGNGELPAAFALHGKVERGAIGRMADGSLHYFLTRNRESMYDFADALREYGVMDAGYITGGNGYEFYRDKDGVAHVSQRLKDHYAKYPDRKVPAPMLVFRTKHSPGS
ncbi:MAG: phosphodiester glycosidase family protein, partial [Muribaculaceae bacterium]|nr:phosphodiester glycosidase family protein [Muribaculaceae bacterium]